MLDGKAVVSELWRQRQSSGVGNGGEDIIGFVEADAAEGGRFR